MKPIKVAKREFVIGQTVWFPVLGNYVEGVVSLPPKDLRSKMTVEFNARPLTIASKYVYLQKPPAATTKSSQSPGQPVLPTVSESGISRSTVSQTGPLRKWAVGDRCYAGGAGPFVIIEVDEAFNSVSADRLTYYPIDSLTECCE